MKFLLDTNIIIPLEPTSVDNIEPALERAARFVQLANRAGARLFIHPAQWQDLNNDTNTARRELRALLTTKYQWLDKPPSPSPEQISVIGESEAGTNNFVDDHLLAAIAAPATDYLVSEDQGILRKASRLDIRDRVLSLADAITVLEDLFDRPTDPPPAVERVLAYQLAKSDPIWESFRQDYPDFDVWLHKCMVEHRPAWVIPSAAGYAGIQIVNHEIHPPYGMRGKVLKLCSFKVSESHGGNRFGELLLKTLFRYASNNNYGWIFVEAYAKQERLIRLFEDFGFRLLSESSKGELVYSKPLALSVAPEALSGLAFNVRYGPEAIDWTQPAFLIPIQPVYDALLFPDQQDQQPLNIGEHPYGNSIRKAYLCHAATNQVATGSITVFYRSGDKSRLSSLGVVEDVLRSSNPDKIATFVAKRTVYTYGQITAMARKPVLAILFRHAEPIMPVMRLHDLRAAGVIKSPPRSIMRLTEEAKQWIMTQVDR